MLDGAMGTMIQRYALAEADFRGTLLAEHPQQLKGNNDLLVLTRPDVIRDIHSRYLCAGADIIETCTFNANAISQGEYGCAHLCADINRAAAKLAREVADSYSTPDKPRYVAGSVGPTGRTCSMSPDVENPALRNVTFDMLVEAYEEQMTALLEGGVDALLCETTNDPFFKSLCLFKPFLDNTVVVRISTIFSYIIVITQFFLCLEVGNFISTIFIKLNLNLNLINRATYYFVI